MLSNQGTHINCDVTKSAK